MKKIKIILKEGNKELLFEDTKGELWVRYVGEDQNTVRIVKYEYTEKRNLIGFPYIHTEATRLCDIPEKSISCILFDEAVDQSLK